MKKIIAVAILVMAVLMTTTTVSAEKWCHTSWSPSSGWSETTCWDSDGCTTIQAEQQIETQTHDNNPTTRIGNQNWSEKPLTVRIGNQDWPQRPDTVIIGRP